MRDLDTCVAPVLMLDEMLDDEHVGVARQMAIELVDPRVGPVRHVGVGPKLSGTPAEVRGTAPVLGEHTDEMLAALGYGDAARAALRASGVVA